MAKRRRVVSLDESLDEDQSVQDNHSDHVEHSDQNEPAPDAVQSGLSPQASFINNSDYINEASEHEKSYKSEGTPDLKGNDTSDTSDEIMKSVNNTLKSDQIPMLTPDVESDLELEPATKSVGIDTKTDSNLNFSQQLVALSPTKGRLSLQSLQSQVQASKAAEPRLVIEQLVLTNFKSYAGRQVIGPFNASFSAVVGPNGSGKSNVIDSLLFVFGFRASKMRQGKLSELIHNSEGNRLDFCQVDIHFNHVVDQEDDQPATVVPESGLIVSRKAYKNNTSQYYINGKSSNYTEVTTLLKDKGIDLDHKRFLILQGEVESIAQMKPKAEKESDDGLLEYLEDIIGTSYYKDLIETNTTKVEELNEVCIEKSNRFELVEKDKTQLEERKKDALEFLEREKILIHLKSLQFQINIDSNTSNLEDHQARYNQLKEKYDGEREKNLELNQQLEDQLSQQKKFKANIESISKEIHKRNDKVKVINKAIVTVDEKIKNLNNKLKKNNKSKDDLEQSLSLAQSKLNSQSEASEQYKKDLHELTTDLNAEKAKLDDLRAQLTSKTSVYTKEIEELQTKLQPWNDKLEEKVNAIKLIDSSIGMLRSQKEESATKLDTARQKLIEIKKEGKEKEAQYIENQEKLEHIVEQIGLGEEQINNERKHLQTQKNNLISTRSKVQDKVSTHQHNQNKNRVLASLSRLAKSGRIQGFCGRLGDLGVIDDKYDIAISTACTALDSIVVETVETAQACIQYLRKNNLGYANFVCLDKLRRFDMSPIQTPGNPATVKRLFDLIQPKNERFMPAFYSKIYNTLVASNLQEAKLVAYGRQRFRVVTLDGKLVDNSGTMSGGGNSFARGGMILASAKQDDSMDLSEEDIEQLKQELNNMEAKYDREHHEFQTKETQLRNLQDLKPEIELTISKLRMDIEALSSERKEVSNLCKRLISESENNEEATKIDQEILSKEAEKQQIQVSVEELQAGMSDLQTRIAELEEKILEAGGVELRLQSSKVDSIKQKIEIINDKTSNERMAIRKLENEIKRSQKLLDESIKQISNTERELEDIKSHDSNKQGELDQLNGEIEEYENQRDALKEQLDTLADELDVKTKEINKFKSLEIELTNKIEKETSYIKKLQHDVNVDEENLNALIVRDTADYIEWLEPEEQEKYNGGEIKRLLSEELEKVDIEQVNGEINEIEKYMANVKVDIEILKEYGIKIREFKTRQQELHESITNRDEIKNYCEELKKKRLDEFMEGFNAISLSLKEMYQMITMGGNAELELVDSLDPFAEGILFSVMPPKKSWKNISNLSGGEKTLSSLALVFALHKYKPTPLYVMDEIDAALDFRNVSIVANYIKERTKNGQFIVISLRNNMFELAKQLVGIYKVDNRTKSVSLQNKEFI